MHVHAYTQIMNLTILLPIVSADIQFPFSSILHQLILSMGPHNTDQCTHTKCSGWGASHSSLVRHHVLPLIMKWIFGQYCLFIPSMGWAFRWVLTDLWTLMPHLTTSLYSTQPLPWFQLAIRQLTVLSVAGEKMKELTPDDISRGCLCPHSLASWWPLGWCVSLFSLLINSNYETKLTRDEI